MATFGLPAAGGKGPLAAVGQPRAVLKHMNALPTLSRSGPSSGIRWVVLAALLWLTYANDWQYDEAVTYTCVEGLGLWDLVAYTKFKTANHQLLNSLSFLPMQYLGLKGAFFFRLLSITGFVMFYRANARILSMYRIEPWYILPLIIAPYFYYFSQGRGYSFALGCFACSLLYLLRYRQTGRPVDEHAMMLFGCLSALSIFSFYFAVASLFLAYAIPRLKRGIDLHFATAAAVFLLLTLYIRYGGSTIQASDPWIIGTGSLFKNGSLSSILSDFSLYRLFGNLRFYPYYKALIALCIILPLFYGLRGAGRPWPDRLRNLAGDRWLPLLLIVTSFALMAAAHHVMKAMYPLNRAVFFIHYLVLLSVVIATHAFRGGWSWHRLPLFVVFLASCLQVSAVYANLFKPGIRQHIETAGDRPLYILATGYNPNVRLTNRLASIDKADIHQVSKNVRVMDSLIRADTSRRLYLLTHVDFIDSLSFDKRKVHEGRDDLVLFEVKRRP
jgi:hypothetical protein